MEAVTLVRVLGTLLCVLGIALCIWVGRKRADQVSTKEHVSVGIAVLSAAALWKLLAFGALVATPAAVVAVANYHTFVGIHEVEACYRCHVMRPMVNDMTDPASDTLAARHFKNRWIPKDQIGRASCRERVEISGLSVTCKNKE